MCYPRLLKDNTIVITCEYPVHSLKRTESCSYVFLYELKEAMLQPYIGAPIKRRSTLRFQASKKTLSSKTAT